MLTIYSGRECLDKERFIFDHVEGKTLLLVPDQFTLGAEQRAFSLLGVRGLMDLEVLSPSRLGMRILERLGGARTPCVDRVGRHMLLSRILREEGGQLDIFRGMEGKPAFALALNDLISEMKQLGTTPELLQELLDSLPEGEEPLLCRKLRDVHRVYRRYEEEMAGRFADTEDRMSLYIRRIREDKELRETQVWVWGFDYFTPKNLEMLRELMKFAREVRLVLTLDEGAEQGSSPEARPSPSGASRDRDLFAVTREMKERVRRIAREEGIAVREEPIPQAYRIPVGEGPEEKRPAIAGLERELFAIPMRAVEEREGVTLIRAATLYGEAESAAAKIISLVRDEGLRFRDMAVICNDLEGRGSVIRRVFEEYGIPVFLDKKRSCAHNPLVEFLSATLDLILGGWRTEDVFRMVKTGLAPLGPEEAEELENYAVQYRVRGSQWKKPFFRGRLEYGEERLADRNREREALVSGLASLEEDFCRATEVGGKLRALYRWMSGEAALPDKLDAMMMELEAAGWQELADETRQIWQAVVELMDQMMLLLGEEELPDEELAALMNTGFAAMEIGLIPPTVDRLTVGTMQRSRVPRIKALLVIGANEGILPQEKGLEGLLSEEEKRRLHGNRIPVCQSDELRSREERLGIYRMLSLPQRHLWVSCAATDQEGKEIKPSPVFEALVRLWGAPPDRDLLSRCVPEELLAAPRSGLRHLTDALRKSLEGEALADSWHTAIDWYRERKPEDLERLAQGLFHTGKKENLTGGLAGALYRREGSTLRISPSGLERYSRCPFAYWMNYGIRPESRMAYQITGRDLGDIYHRCLMEISRKLTRGREAITQPDSLWMTLTREECFRLTDQAVEQEAGRYREGLLDQGPEERYKTERIKRVCREITWALIGHVRQGRIRRVAFEAGFGSSPGAVFPAIRMEAGGHSVEIEGKIDRVDVLPGDRAKIIDYKSGNERFRLLEAATGYRLQLMIYLKAVQDAIAPQEPGAGVFYFHIEEAMLDASGVAAEQLGEALKQEQARRYRLDGMLLDDEEVIRSIAGEFTDYSDVCSLRRSGGSIRGTGPGRLLTEEEFRELRQRVDGLLAALCRELLEGKVPASPMKSDSDSACDYCPFRTVCGFDTALPGCRYRSIS